jgi:hypothetical protein
MLSWNVGEGLYWLNVHLLRVWFWVVRLSISCNTPFFTTYPFWKKKTCNTCLTLLWLCNCPFIKSLVWKLKIELSKFIFDPANVFKYSNDPKWYFFNWNESDPCLCGLFIILNWNVTMYNISCYLFIPLKTTLSYRSFEHFSHLCQNQ